MPYWGDEPLYFVSGDEPTGAAGRSHLVIADSESVARELVEKIAPHFRMDELKILQQEQRSRIVKKAAEKRWSTK
jgi:hypothetical protein